MLLIDFQSERNKLKNEPMLKPQILKYMTNIIIAIEQYMI